MATFAETLQQFSDMDPPDPNTFLQTIWPQLSPAQREAFSALLSQPNQRRAVAVQGAEGQLGNFTQRTGMVSPVGAGSKSGTGATTQPAPRSQYAGNFVPSGVEARGALSGQAPGTSSSGWTNKIHDNLTIRDLNQGDGTAKFENVQTGNEVQIQAPTKTTTGGGFVEVGQPTAGGAAAQTFSGEGGTSTIASTAANYQSPIKQRIKLRSGEWLDVG